MLIDQQQPVIGGDIMGVPDFVFAEPGKQASEIKETAVVEGHFNSYEITGTFDHEEDH